MTNYSFSIVNLSGIRCEADIFVQLSFIIRTLLIEIVIEKSNPYLRLIIILITEKLKLIAIFGVFAASGVQCKAKIGGSLSENVSDSRNG